MQTKKKSIYTFYKKRINTFLAHIKQTENLCQEDTIHSLRVEIKKLRAIFMFLEKIESKEWNGKKPYNLFKPLFKEAGIIREAQLNLKLILTYRLPPTDLVPFIDFLEHKQIQSEIALKKLVNKFDTKGLDLIHTRIKKISKKLNYQVLFSHACLVLTDEIMAIEKNQKSITNEKMHNIRKHVKRIDTLLDMLSKIKPISSLTQFLAHLKTTQKTIGEWHDTLVLSESLHEFLKSQQKKIPTLKRVQRKVFKNSKTILQQLKKEISHLNNEMKQRLNPTNFFLKSNYAAKQKTLEPLLLSDEWDYH